MLKLGQLFFVYASVFDRMRHAIVVAGDERSGFELHLRVAGWPSPFREAGELAIRDVAMRVPRRARRHVLADLRLLVTPAPSNEVALDEVAAV